MLIKASYSFVYDTEDKEFFNEFLQYMDDHELSFSGFKEFIIDRFINPNFEKGGTTNVEILPLTKCARCGSMLSFKNVSPGYYAVCPEHDEDLYEVECI